MTKLVLNKPLVVLMYGFPGAGKTAFARQMADSLGVAHLEADRIRAEIFESPRFDKRENDLINHLMDYMTEEFLRAGVSVLYDGDAGRLGRRRNLRDLARKAKANHALIWLQIDLESAFARAHNRDKRKTDDRFAHQLDRTSFESQINSFQNPSNEDYIVISGKHTFNTQRSAVMKKLYELGLIDTSAVTTGVIKPELVNLIPSLRRGRVDPTRRNIIIR